MGIMPCAMLQTFWRMVVLPAFALPMTRIWKCRHYHGYGVPMQVVGTGTWWVRYRFQFRDPQETHYPQALGTGTVVLVHNDVWTLSGNIGRISLRFDYQVSIKLIMRVVEYSSAWL